jgi:hypothetical protein
MSLKDEFRESAMVENGLTTLEKYEQIADEFAIGFAEWCIESEGKDYNKYKYRNRKELLEIYKKEKGL